MYVTLRVNLQDVRIQNSFIICVRVMDMTCLSLMESVEIGYMKGGGKALWKDENLADSILAHAVKFILNHKKEPFFMYFATNDVHVPRFPHKRFRGRIQWE